MDSMDMNHAMHQAEEDPPRDEMMREMGDNHMHLRSQSHASADHSQSMQMWFFASSSTTILFKDWKTEEIWQLVLSCVFWFIIAFLYEVLKAVRQEIIIRDVGSRKSTLPVSGGSVLDEGNTHNCPDHHGGLAMNGAGGATSQIEACPCVLEASRSRMSPPGQELVEIQMIPPHGFMATSWRYQMFSNSHLIQTCLHIVQMGTSYVLMLVVMTFNVWLFLAIILGLGAGYFVCGWWHCGPVVDPNEHCH